MKPDSEDNPYAAPAAVSTGRSLKSDWYDLPPRLAFPVILIFLQSAVFIWAFGDSYVEDVQATGLTIDGFLNFVLMCVLIPGFGIVAAIGLIRRSRWGYVLSCLYFLGFGMTIFSTGSSGMGGIFSWVCMYLLLSKNGRVAMGFGKGTRRGGDGA